MQAPIRPFRGILTYIIFLLAAFAGTAYAESGSAIDHFVFDADVKHYDAKPQDTNAVFQFFVTNTWTNEITVERVQTSCGCTTASLPSNPWHLAPNNHGALTAIVNLVGKAPGTMTKTITLYLSTNSTYLGTKVATVKVTIPHAARPETMSEADRKAAVEMAKGNPQKIFKDPQCAKCHVDQGKNAWGRALYVADCGICHDSPNRASFVPDLHQLKTPVSFDYWKTIITLGKPTTMMPAFASAHGGPLSDDQVHSLAEYLDHTFKAPSQ